MKIRFTLSLTLFLSFSSLYAQRELTKIADPFRMIFSTAAGEDVVYLAGDSAFFTYDGTSLLRINYPRRSGNQLSYGSSGLTKTGDNLYMLLRSGGNRFLYRFSGGSFSAVPIPGEIRSVQVLYQNEVYIVSRIASGSPMKLYRYDGSAVHEVPDVSLPAFGDITLRSADPYLYVVVDEDSLLRYDGSTVRRLPDFNLFGNVRDILTISGTNDTYLQVWNDKIWHYNESTVTAVYDRFSVYSEFIEWKDKLWFYATWLPEEEGHLYAVQDDVLQEIFLPDTVSFIPRSNIAVFRDTLYVPAKTASGTTVVYSYDDTGFTKFLETAAPANQAMLYSRADDLLVHPDFRNGDTAYYYDGTGVESIIAPAGNYLRQYRASAECFHLWTTQPDLSPPTSLTGVIAVEKADCVVGRNYIIPEKLRAYEKMNLFFNGRNRNWCWSEIMVDWVITPVCPNPQTCPDPLLLLSLSDEKGNVVWSEKHQQPFKTSLLKLEDLPFTLSMAMEDQEPILQVSPELVSKGIQEISIFMEPSEERFVLSISGEKNNVPVSLCLLSKDRKIIWQEKIFVPFQGEITATAGQPGYILYISDMENISLYKKAKKIKKVKKK